MSRQSWPHGHRFRLSRNLLRWKVIVDLKVDNLTIYQNHIRVDFRTIDICFDNDVVAVPRSEGLTP